MLEEVKDLFAEVLNISKDSIQLDTRLNEDLGVDSMDMYNLIDLLENRFKIDLLEVGDISTIGDIIRVIEEKRSV